MQTGIGTFFKKLFGARKGAEHHDRRTVTGTEAARPAPGQEHHEPHGELPVPTRRVKNRIVKMRERYERKKRVRITCPQCARRGQFGYSRRGNLTVIHNRRWERPGNEAGYGQFQAIQVCHITN